MARSRRKRGRSKRPRAHTYRGSLLAAALLTASLTFLCVVIVDGAALSSALADLRRHPEAPSSAPLSTLAVAILLPLLVGIVAAALAALLIPVVRESLYLRHLHRFLAAYLATYDRIRSPEQMLRGVRFDPRGDARSDAPVPLSPMLSSASRVLLLGEPGIGKTFALHRLAYELTRKRRLVRLGARRGTLPVLIQLPSYAHAVERDGTSFRHWVGQQLGVFGTPGLAARLPALVRRRRFLLLCDGLDDVPAHLRGRVCEDLAALIADKGGRHRVIVTCRLDRYTHDLRHLPALRAFERIVMTGLTGETIERALRHIHASRAHERSARTSTVGVLTEHALADSAEQPAQLAELVAVAPHLDTLPFGRSALAHSFVEAICRMVARADLEERLARQLVGALAAALRQADRHTLPIAAGESAGAAVLAWLAAHPAPSPAESTASLLDLPSAHILDTLCDAARAAGLLRLSSDGGSIGFDNAIFEASFAADWLASTDDQLGRLSPDLLRTSWTLPVILWGASAPHPSDVAQRLLRLADAPDSTAARAGLTSGAETLPAAVALVLGILAEGQVAALSRVANTDHEQGAAEAAQQALRDVLDPAHAHAAEPEQADALAGALQRASELAGPEYVSCLRRLARLPLLGRLVRGQIIALLGLIGAPAAHAVLVELLVDPDPVIQSALTQAFITAGPTVIGVLQAATRADDERIRMRASEILLHFGDAAMQTALSSLDDPSAAHRVTATRSLGSLGATAAVAAVIERLGDDSAEVRRAAAHALGQLGTPDSIAALARHAEDDDPGVRVAVARALSAQDDLQAQQALIHMLDDADGQVRAAAATALGVLASPQALRALEEHRTDGDPLAYNAIHQALERLGRRPTTPGLAG